MSIFEKWKQGFQWMKFQDNIGEPPWEYNFLLNLDEREYPKYLAKIFNYRTDEKLPLRYDWKKRAWVIDKNKCKTFNQKIQWLKLYDATPLKKKLTDKVLVRDYVAEKIGEEYLKPVLQIIQLNDITPELQMNSVEKNNIYCLFDLIQFDKLPNSFVMKCSHGCKWQYIVKNKEGVLSTKPLFELIKRNMTGWLEQDYSFWGGFEMQYKRLESKILIEPFLHNEDNSPLREIEVYCFNGKPRIFVSVRYGNKREISYYDENFNQIDLILHPDGNNVVINEKADDYINQTFDLSIKLSRKFKFVRCDWFVYQGKLYFNEMTFTPYSGLMKFDKKWNKKLGNFIYEVKQEG